jgi:hypothetical protein
MLIRNGNLTNCFLFAAHQFLNGFTVIIVTGFLRAGGTAAILILKHLLPVNLPVGNSNQLHPPSSSSLPPSPFPHALLGKPTNHVDGNRSFCGAARTG